jgi:hypothetical protein
MLDRIPLRIFLTGLLILFSLPAISQIVFEKVIGDTLTDLGEKIVADTQGNLIVLAQSNYEQNLIMRFDTNGNLLDSTAFSVTAYGAFRDIAAKQNGNLYVLTAKSDSSNLLELSPDFEIILGNKNLGVNYQFFAVSYDNLAIDAAENVYAYGTEYGYPPPYYAPVVSGLLIKLDANGNVIYQKSLAGGMNACCSWSEILKLQPNGKCLLDVAYSGSYPSHILYSFDDLGNTLSTIEFFGYGLWALEMLDDEKMLILANNVNSCTLSTVDTGGNYLASLYNLFLYQGFVMSFANMHNLDSNHYLLVDNTAINWSQELIAWKLINADGDSLDAAEFVFPDYHRYKADYLSPTNMLYLIGTTFETSNDDQNIDLIKIGIPKYVGIGDPNTANDIVYSFSPNPAKDILRVNLKPFPNCNKYTLQIFTVAGKLFRDWNLSSDEMEISVSDIPAGIYFGRFSGDNNIIFLSKLVIQR